ncbi:hypothetical protein [Paenibacillus sacheonensis]|uniref:Uncharacterized protein n=1 Tax=Paenibacillus sacheonensis TaxID=742054 RepID=A0A7X4YQF6_9BACL|nr:hypothetical protein [Paenibacillus sacheonensis]MBM7566651.1 hypothetical protein [Paenibacillus sacheonensis]NBC70633.1 hypothetical protein [Paenibacillus sacheonensis]
MEHTFTIEPGGFSAFEDEDALIGQCKEWGLLSDKAVKSKAFVYKRGGSTLPCTIVGIVDFMTAVIEFENKQRHLIHPSLLKEMQASTYGQRQRAVETAEAETSDASEEASLAEAVAVKEALDDETNEAASDAKPGAAAPVVDKQPPTPDKPQAEKQPVTAAKEKPAKKKSAKPQLPEEKVKLTAVVKEFTTVPNHFADEDDEVIVYENVAIVEPELELGDAWSSHSNTLKKLELEVGDAITFEAKIVAKKLTKHPVPYKINNPSKIVKQ